MPLMFGLRERAILQFDRFDRSWTELRQRAYHLEGTGEDALAGILLRLESQFVVMLLLILFRMPANHTFKPVHATM